MTLLLEIFGPIMLLSIVAYVYNCNEGVRQTLRTSNDEKDKEDARRNSNNQEV